jgi:hypothetical protein
MAKLYKTTIVFEVLTDEDAIDFIEQRNLGNIVRETIEGNASGAITSFETVEVDPAEMSRLLIAQGSDPEFLLNQWLAEDE